MKKINIDATLDYIIMKNYDKYIFQSKHILCKQEIIKDLQQGKNIVLHGNNDHENYVYVINYFYHISKKKLKFVRKLEIEYNSNVYEFNTTDVFVDVDFDLLGVNEYNIFMELYNLLRESYQQEQVYILCHNFQKIRKELHNSLYTILNSDPRIRFIFITSQVEFINKALLSQCVMYKNHQCNINYNYFTSFHQDHCEKMKNIIMKKIKIELKELRDFIYEILIYNFNVSQYVSHLIEKLLFEDYITETNNFDVLRKTTQILEKYNNNYRAIFHLEYLIIYLINLNVS